MKLVVDAEHGANTVNPLRVAPQERLHIDGGGAEMMHVVDASAQSVVRTKDGFDGDLGSAASEGEGLRGIVGVELKPWIPKSGITVADAGVDADAESWFTRDAEDESVLHGPHSTAKLAEWLASGEVSGDTLVQDGRHGHVVHLAAVFDAAETGWFYDDDDDDSHGPYTLTKLAAWLDDEHLDECDCVRRSIKGGDVEVSTLYAALHRHRGREGWFYQDVNVPAKLQGPFSRVQLEKWDADGHFEEGVVAASVQYSWAELCAVRAAAEAKYTAEAAEAEGGGAQAPLLGDDGIRMGY
jgi:hypothetical protein